MLYNKYIGFITVLFVSLLVRCAAPTDEELPASNEQRQTFKEETVGSAVVETSSDSVSLVIRCNGRIEVPPQYRADIYARTAGFVEKVAVLKGSSVKKGQLIASITHQDILHVQQQYLNAKIELERAEKAYNRHLSLQTEDAISEKEVEKSKTEYEQELTRLKSLEEELAFMGIPLPQSEHEISAVLEVRSPLDGFVNLVDANLGRYVQANHLLAEVIDDSHKHIELEVFPEFADRLKMHQRVVVKQSGSDQTIEGYVFLINKAIDEAKQTVNVHVHPIGDNAFLRVSAYVEAQIFIDQFIEDQTDNSH